MVRSKIKGNRIEARQIQSDTIIQVRRSLCGMMAAAGYSKFEVVVFFSQTSELRDEPADIFTGPGDETAIWV
jgi:hypothetical protein